MNPRWAPGVPVRDETTARYPLPPVGRTQVAKLKVVGGLSLAEYGTVRPPRPSKSTAVPVDGAPAASKTGPSPLGVAVCPEPEASVASVVPADSFINQTPTGEPCSKPVPLPVPLRQEASLKAGARQFVTAVSGAAVVGARNFTAVDALISESMAARDP